MARVIPMRRISGVYQAAPQVLSALNPPAIPPPIAVPPTPGPPPWIWLVAAGAIYFLFFAKGK